MKAIARFVRRIRTTRRIGGPAVSEYVYTMIWSMRNPNEREALRRQPLQAKARLDWVAKDRGVSVRQIVAEIVGAGTAVGVILADARGPCMASRFVKFA